MNLLETINKRLLIQHLSVELRLNASETDIRVGQDWIYCNEAIKPILVLIEDDKVVLKADSWESLLNKIEREYGQRFMRQTDLDSLRENRYNTTDREEDY